MPKHSGNETMGRARSSEKIRLIIFNEINELNFKLYRRRYRKAYETPKL